jgi:hypothetical protein
MTFKSTGKSLLAGSLLAASLALPIDAALAKVPEAKAAELGGPTLNCIGAEKAGTASGVAAYTGKWTDNWPGVKKINGFEPGPYVDEKPLFTITAQNADKYAANLTAGEKALLKKYPDAFKMNVYPSHRDFGYQDGVCANTRKNATTSEVLHDGKAISGTTGTIPFPFPQSGLEAIWNVINAIRPWTEVAVNDIADVYSNGSIAWGRAKFQTMNMGNQPGKPGSYQDKINAYFYDAFFLPERQKGFVAVGYQPNDFSTDATQSWQYQPGIRRVRQAPEVGFDYPVPPAGLRTVDDDYGFNGSPERYTWKLVGKKEFYVPYNNFKVNDPAIKYSDLIKPNTVNSDYIRYELHRVWVIEGTLKEGVRHIYSKREVYADEDTWLVNWADAYDGRGQLWRANYVTFHYSPEAKSYHRGATIYHDLTSGAYEAGYLVNERGNDWWKLNVPLSPSQFSPDAAARGGH